jgi:hypothetical protein
MNINYISVSSRAASENDGKSKSEFINELIKLKLVTLQTLRVKSPHDLMQGSFR